METIHLFMPLLTELGGFEGGLRYKHVAPNGALAAGDCARHDKLKAAF